jgi:hypothetical protein
MLLSALLIGPLFVAILPGAALAECNPPGASISFIRTAPYAQRILVGRVVEAGPDPDGQGPARHGVTFTLDVQQVLRGPAVAELRIDHLETGGCERWLSAADGDVIALALETRGRARNLASATGAWIEGRPPTSTAFDVLSLAEVVEAAATPRPPDTGTVGVQNGPRSVPWLVGGATVIGSLAMLSIVGRQLRASAKPRPRRTDSSG